MSGPGRTPQTFDCGPAGMLTMRQMAKRIGIPTNTVKRRLYDGWKPVEVIAGERECEDKFAHRWRTAWLRPKVLAYASERMRTPIVNQEKLPLAYDPWCQAAIDVAEEDGGFTLDEIGVILGGISRERVRQIERAAFAKIRRYTGLKSKAEILAMLRALEADRVVNTNSFELVESLERGECQLKQKRKEAKP